MNFWPALFLVAVFTFLFRYSFLSGHLSFTLPRIVRRGLEYVPAAVLAALVSTTFFLDAQKALNLTLASGVTFVVAVALAVRFRRDLLTIITGLVLYWLLTLI